MTETSVTKEQEALERFQSDCNCCQAVLLSFCSDYGIDEKLAKDLSSGFGGGMRIGETCGALCGAMMVMGIKNGKQHSDAAAQKAQTAAQAIYLGEQFKENMGTVSCHTILAKNKEEKLPARSLCKKAVSTAVELLEALK